MNKKQLRHGRYIADLYVNRKSDPPIFHYTITEDGSDAILSWGQEGTMDETERAAQRTMEYFASRRAG